MTPAAKPELETDSPSASHLRLVRDDVDIRIYGELVSAGQRAEIQGRSAQARELYETALTRLAGAESGARASDLLRWIARTHLVEANLELALDCANAAVAIAEAHNDEAAAGNAINIQANLHCQQGELDAAERLYLRAGESAARSGDAKLAAMTAQNLAVIANIRGDLDTARQYYESSLLAYRTLGLAKDVCVALNNLGLLHTQRELWAEAAAAYDEAMCIADALGDQNACVQIDVNRAECLVAQGRHADAREACERATLRSKRVQDSGILGELHKAFGIVERETGNFERAELSLLEAKAIATQRQNLLLLADVTKECAELHRRQGRNRDTLQALNQAHRLFQQLRARRELADLGRRMERLETSFLDVARRWGESIESKDHYTQGHCERVAELACALAARTGMEEQSLFWFRIGALLHDVGKLVIPPEVLNKAGSLTPDEWTMMRNHPAAGVEMLADVEFPWDVRPIVESHHERWDGGGYPHGLRGESIPFVARILCIADVYDALTSQRSYKKALTHAEAIDAMRLEVGAQFDPRLFALFEELAPAPAKSEVHTAMPPLVPYAAAPAASHDELTELPLRRAFSQAATAALATRGPDETVAMLVIDVDHFKLINDTYGHLRGDDVLRAVAHVLLEHKRPGDFLGRYAGDEFVMVLPGATMRDATELAERVRVAMHAVPIAADGVGPLALTISTGLAVAPQHGTTVELLFARADAALLAVKRQGRDAVGSSGGVAGPARAKPRLEQFVGRQAERRMFVDRLDEAARGEPRILSIVGEAGVGKSTFARAFGPEIRSRGASMIAAGWADTRTPAAYEAWSAVLDSVRLLRLVPDRHWRALSQLVPELALGSAADPTAERSVLFAEVCDYLHRASAVRPLVIVLDNMQWADAASWDLLEHAAAQLDRERLLICMTMRAEDVRGEVLERRQRLSRNERFDEISLPRLSAGELQAWLASALEQDPDPQMVTFLFRRSEGNPFIAAQFLRLAIDKGDLEWTPHEWRWRQPAEAGVPTAVRDLLMRRLAGLSKPVRRMLAAAAVLGRTVDIDRAVAAGIATDDALLDAVDEGMHASVLDIGSMRSPNRLTFSHGILVDLLLETFHSRRTAGKREAPGSCTNATESREHAAPARRTSNHRGVT